MIKNRGVLLLLIVMLGGVMGCSEKSMKSTKVEEVEVPSEESKESEEVKPKTSIINIVDPNTKEVIKTFIPVNLGFGTEDDLYQQEMKNLAKNLARGTDVLPGYDRRMILDKLDSSGKIIKGSPRVILNETELVEKILAVSATGGTVELPISVMESSYQLEDTAHLNERLLASYTTYFNPSVQGRMKNIELSAEAIHNVIVGNGDYFSFNTMVGKRTVENGYQPAPEAVNGELVMGIGGGICQTSSTLFNAVDQLAVEYVEKHHHSVTVGYVPEGRDATVSDSGLDFRFQNKTGVPFIIKTVIKNGALTVEIRTSNQYAASI